MSDQRVYTASEVAAWVPPDCPRCGKNDRVSADWKQLGIATGGYIQGLLDCPCQREQIQASIFD